jgi:hypothetical protein
LKNDRLDKVGISYQNSLQKAVEEIGNDLKNLNIGEAKRKVEILRYFCICVPREVRVSDFQSEFLCQRFQSNLDVDIYMEEEPEQR